MNQEELLSKGAMEIGVTFSKKEINAFITYLAELKKWNRTYNLTALKTDKNIIIKHFLDSLLYLKAFSEGRLKVADAGSGAGFPGIPLGILRPDVNIILIESTGKKAAFLRHMIRILKLTEISVVEERIEELGNEYNETFDIILTRATFKIRDFIDKADKYLKKDGMLVLSKGPNFELELNESPYAGYQIKDILNFQLPFIKDERNLVMLKCI